MQKGKSELPLLLLDNSAMHVLSTGWYKIEPMTFDEAKILIEAYDPEDVLCCYTDKTIDTVIHEYIGIEKKDYAFKRIRRMRSGQMAIVFKFYIEDSKSKPVVEPAPGIEAKKIQNVYVYCECISSMEATVKGLIDNAIDKQSCDR